MEKTTEISIVPRAAFPGKVSDLITQLHEQEQLPVNYVAAAMLATISTAIGNSRILRKGQMEVHPILYVGLLGDSGSAKSPAMKFITRPLANHDDKTLDTYRRELEDYKKNPVGRDKPIPSQLIVKDSTLEGLIKVMSFNPNGILLQMDELNAWISSFNKYRKGGGDCEAWLSFHDGDSYTVNRKTIDEVVHVKHPFVSIIGGIQTKVLVKAFSGDNMDNGLLFRMIFAPNSSEGKPILWQDGNPDADLQKQWEEIVNRVLEKRTFDMFGSEEYTLDADAWFYIKDWQNTKETELAEGGDPVDASIFRKTQMTCFKFCLILHTLREAVGEIPPSKIIDTQTAIKAVLLTEYFFETARYVVELIDGNGVDMSRFQRWYDILNETFTTEQAQALGTSLGIPRTTVFRFLKNGLIEKLGYGKYKKLI